MTPAPERERLQSPEERNKLEGLILLYDQLSQLVEWRPRKILWITKDGVAPHPVDGAKIG